MPTEAFILLIISLYRAAQAAITGRSGPPQQIHYNFPETFFLFAEGILLVPLVGTFGAWSAKGSAVYTVGGAACPVLPWGAARPLRKWAWAASIAGIVGVLADFIRIAFSAQLPDTAGICSPILQQRTAPIKPFRRFRADAAPGRVQSARQSTEAPRWARPH